MKILLADDSAAKIKAVIQALTTRAGLARDNIIVAQSAIDARRVLQQEHIDLLIIDILLPLRPEDPPSVQTSLDLLEELIDEGTYHKPAHVIGLTAYVDAAAEAGPHFTDMLWTLLVYDETANDWSDPLCKSIEYLSAQQVERVDQYGSDLCVITALRSPEMDAVHRLRWGWESYEPLDDSTFFRRGRFKSDDGVFNVVTCVSSRMGMVASSLAAAKMISSFRPRFIVMTGICAGIKDKVNIGDVIFADPTWDWQSGKRVQDRENTQFAISPHQLPVPEFIRSRIEQLASDQTTLSLIKNGWPGGPATTELKLRLGPLASGSAVLADGQVVHEIRNQHRSLLGIEMEAYGLYTAAQYSSYPRPTAFALKSVCDFADPDKSDKMQEYAAYTSAETMAAFFERYMGQISQLAGT